MQDTNAEVSFFDKAGEWDSLDCRVYKKIVAIFKRTIKPKKGDKVLEVGCGTGSFTKELLDLHLKIVGIDVSKKAIGLAKRKIKKAIFLVDNIEKTKLKKDSFDIIIFSSVFHHFLEHDDMLKQTYKLLRKNGKVFGYDPCADNPIIFLARSKRSPIAIRKNMSKNEEYLTIREFQTIINKTGLFKDIKARTIRGIKYNPSHFKRMFKFPFYYSFYAYNILNFLVERISKKGSWMVYKFQKNL